MLQLGLVTRGLSVPVQVQRSTSHDTGRSSRNTQEDPARFRAKEQIRVEELRRRERGSDPS